MRTDMHNLPADGAIDIHSHLLPGIDDGCQTLEESLECIGRLKQAGYIGTICTPHIWECYPHNCATQIEGRVAVLQRELADRQIDYHLWPGGEVRLYKGIIKWFKKNGVPTLAGTRVVLTDFWDRVWPKYALKTYRWLINEGYQPILAHPERMPDTRGLLDHLDELREMGVWLQGNFACFTGEEGFNADHLCRKLLTENAYQFLAMDMHGPGTLELRLTGRETVEIEYDAQTVQRLTVDAPRQLIFGQPA